MVDLSIRHGHWTPKSRPPFWGAVNPDAGKLTADLIDQIDVLQSEDIAQTVAFLTAVPKHVNLTEITIIPTAQAI